MHLSLLEIFAVRVVRCFLHVTCSIDCQYLQWREDAVCIYCELYAMETARLLIRSIGAAIGTKNETETPQPIRH